MNRIINHSYDIVTINKLKMKVRETLYVLYEEYNLLNSSYHTQSTRESQVLNNIDVDDVNIDPKDFIIVMSNEERVGQQTMQFKFELDKISSRRH